MISLIEIFHEYIDKQNYQIEDYPNDENVSDIDEKFEQIYTSATKDLDMNGDDVRLPDGDSSFNLDNVEFADASDKEDLPDAMTAYEADRLLSSRLVVHTFSLSYLHCITVKFSILFAFRMSTSFNE